MTETRSKRCCKKAARSRRRATFRKTALDTDATVYDDAERDWQGFWATQALALDWAQEWDTILEWELPFAKWFVGGKLNVSYNCLDRHVDAGHGDQVAFHWEGEPGDTPRRHLPRPARRDVPGRERCCGRSASRRAIASRSTWAWCPRRSPRCSRARASARAHSVVFGGFTAQSLKDRINDARGQGARHRRRRVAARRGRRAEGHRRRGARRHAVDRARARVAPHRERRARCKPAATSGGTTRCPASRAECACESMDAEDLLFLLYTSGTTGQAQGHHAHDRRLPHAGRVHAQVRVRPEARHRRLLVHRRRRLGHRSLVHRLRAAREPRDERALRRHARLSRTRTGFWSIVEKYKVTIFYTAPTAIRTFMKWGDELPAAHDLSSLRLIGTVGEPINPEAWVWYYQVIGGGRCPVVDTWWQTETGAIMISALPGRDDAEARQRDVPAARASRPTSSTTRASRSGSPAAATSCSSGRGRRCCAASGATRERYRDTYWSRFDGKYFAGDGAKRDDDGYFWLLGRVDDIMLVVGSQHLDDRGRVRARRPSRGRRSRGRRARPTTRPGRRSPRS